MKGRRFSSCVQRNKEKKERDECYRWRMAGGLNVEKGLEEKRHEWFLISCIKRSIEDWRR